MLEYDFDNSTYYNGCHYIVEQELPSRPEHLSSTPVSSGVHVLLFPITYLHVVSSMLWSPLQFPRKHDVQFVFILQLFVACSCFIYVICIYLRILVSKKISKTRWYSCRLAVIMTGAPSRAGTAFPSRAPQITPAICEVRVARSLVFYVVFCRSLFVIISYFFFWLLYCL